MLRLIGLSIAAGALLVAAPLARLRRELPTVLFAERLGISRDTLSRLEKGDPNIALGTYMRALRVLGLDKDMDAIARDDEGRTALCTPAEKVCSGEGNGHVRSSSCPDFR